MVGRKVGRLVVDAAIRAATLGRILSLRARATRNVWQAGRMVGRLVVHAAIWDPKVTTNHSQNSLK